MYTPFYCRRIFADVEAVRRDASKLHFHRGLSPSLQALPQLVPLQVPLTSP